MSRLVMILLGALLSGALLGGCTLNEGVPLDPAENTAEPNAATPVQIASTVSAKPSRFPGSELEAFLQLPDTLAKGDVVELTFSLINNTDSNLYVLKWFTPLEGIGGEIFRVKRDGQTVPYQGILVSRGDPTPDAYVSLAAGEAAMAQVDLATSYDFSKGGTYTIEYISPRVSHVTRTEAGMAKTLSELGPVQIPANVVAVKLDG